jgi:hypothetical protein
MPLSWDPFAFEKLSNIQELLEQQQQDQWERDNPVGLLEEDEEEVVIELESEPEAKLPPPPPPPPPTKEIVECPECGKETLVLSSGCCMLCKAYIKYSVGQAKEPTAGEILKAARESNCKDAFTEIFHTFLGHYKDNLAQQRRRLVIEDQYGNLQVKKWADEIVYFVKSTLAPIFNQYWEKDRGPVLTENWLKYEDKIQPLTVSKQLRRVQESGRMALTPSLIEYTKTYPEHLLGNDLGWFGSSTPYFIEYCLLMEYVGAWEEGWWTGLTNTIDEIAFEAGNQFKDIEGKEVNEMTGVEYEDHCQKILQDLGWQIETTATTGDQGVDLIAVKNQSRICIQCKCYSSPVGNKAVQEAIAGMGFYRGTHAAVVTNAGFTKSAKELAASAGVILLSDFELSNLDQYA